MIYFFLLLLQIPTTPISINGIAGYGRGRCG